MSNDQMIGGLSRDLLVRVFNAADQRAPVDVEDLCELRALLAKPVAQYLAMEVNGKPWVIEEGANADKWRALGYDLLPVNPAAQPQAEPRHIGIDQPHLANARTADWAGVPIGNKALIQSAIDVLESGGTTEQPQIDTARWERLYHQASTDLCAIGEALGIDEDDQCTPDIMEAVERLKTGRCQGEQSAQVAWVPCSPAWIDGGGDCANAPRQPGKPGSGTSHYHPALPPLVVVPEGWKLVPIDPTSIMNDAGAGSDLPIQLANTWSARKVWEAMVNAAPEWPSNQLGSNRYGLDVNYLTRKMLRLIRDMGNFKPDEMARELARMSKTADAVVMAEPEFNGTSVLHQRLAAADQLIYEGWRLMDGQNGKTSAWHFAASAYINNPLKPRSVADLPVPDDIFGGTGTSSLQYKADLYDEVWTKARSMGFMNVTMALAKLTGHTLLLNRWLQLANVPDASQATLSLETKVALKTTIEEA